MTYLSIFLLAMISVSGVIWTLGWVGRAVDQRLDQWPLFWAVSLWLCVLVPALGLLLLLLPSSASNETLAAFSLHEPLQSLGLIPSSTAIDPARVEGLNMAVLVKAVIAIYGVGVCAKLAKLAWGRSRIRAIILKADCAEIAGQDDVLVSPRIQSPFAWTPFGFPRDSRIVVPETYRGVVSEARLLYILTHERAHISRRDDECGLILRVILCLCWVSPFAHQLFARWSQSTEIRCDMAVTAHRDPKMRRAYADTLLQALHIVAGRVQQYPAASFSTHRIRNERMRIAHIMNGTQPSYKRGRDSLLLGLAATLVTGLGMMTISATASADPAGKASVKNEVSHAMVSGRLTSGFGPSLDPFNAGKTRDHYGLDIAAPTGTSIYAPAAGIIIKATNNYNGNPKYGNVVVLQTEDGVVTMFAHLDSYNVKAGQRVTQGARLADVGSSGKSTGPHVHIETYRNGERVDPAEVWDIRVN